MLHFIIASLDGVQCWVLFLKFPLDKPHYLCGSSTKWIHANGRDLVYSYSTISSHRKNTNTKACVKAGKPVALHYEDFSQQLLSKTEYSLPRLLQDHFLIEFESWALNEEERMITEYLGNKKSRMNFEAGKG